MRKAIFTSILAIGFTTALAIAAGTPVPYIFQGGDPASASQVNANFQELADRIAADVYDFHNYIPDSSIQSKVFDTVGQCGDKETRNYTRVNESGGTKVTEERIITDTGTPCSHAEFDYLSSTTEFQLLVRRGYDPATATLQSTNTLGNPITRLTSTMKVNTSWADASVITFTPTAPDGATIEKYTLAGIEDVTVPYNGGTTYTACLKIHKSAQSPGDGLTTRHNEIVIWYCPGVGVTKIMALGSSSVLITKELSDIQ